MEVSERLRQDREARFFRGVGAFIRRDFDVLETTMRPDVLMHLPGSSWLAGTYRGPEEVSRCILGLRHVLESIEDHATFLHDGDQMIVKHDIRVHGPIHDVEMTFSVGISYDADERIKSISVEPADAGLFDHVLQTALLAFDASRFT